MLRLLYHCTGHVLTPPSESGRRRRHSIDVAFRSVSMWSRSISRLSSPIARCLLHFALRLDCGVAKAGSPVCRFSTTTTTTTALNAMMTMMLVGSVHFLRVVVAFPCVTHSQFFFFFLRQAKRDWFKELDLDDDAGHEEPNRRQKTTQFTHHKVSSCSWWWRRRRQRCWYHPTRLWMIFGAQHRRHNSQRWGRFEASIFRSAC